MDWTWLLFGFDGRINRATCWLVALIIVCWMIFFGALIAGFSIVFGGPSSFTFEVTDIFAIVDPASLRSLSRANLVPLLVHLIGTPLFVWIYLATSIKRLHDRDKSGWWMVPFFVIPGLYRQFEHRIPESYTVLAVVAFIFTVWGFVEIYCLPGEPWANRFGPNPLPEARARRRTASRWDQQRESEIIPYNAGRPEQRRVKRET